MPDQTSQKKCPVAAKIRNPAKIGKLRQRNMKSNCSVALYFAMCVCDLHERATCTCHMIDCERSKDIRPPPPASLSKNEHNVHYQLDLKCFLT